MACSQPGCRAVLYRGNRSGVCQAHTHQSACRCGKCVSRGSVGGRTVSLRESKPVDFICPRAARLMWREVLRLVIADGASDLIKARRSGTDPHSVIRRARAYFAGRECAVVTMFAGIDVDDDDRVELFTRAIQRLADQDRGRPAHD